MKITPKILVSFGAIFITAPCNAQNPFVCFVKATEPSHGNELVLTNSTSCPYGELASFFPLPFVKRELNMSSFVSLNLSANMPKLLSGKSLSWNLFCFFDGVRHATNGNRANHGEVPPLIKSAYSTHRQIFLSASALNCKRL